MVRVYTLNLAKEDNDMEAIVSSLKKRDIYREDLLYRQFNISNEDLEVSESDIKNRIRLIKEQGTDRLDYKRPLEATIKVAISILHKEGSINPSDYIFLADEKEFSEELSESENIDPLFVTVEITKC